MRCTLLVLLAAVSLGAAPAAAADPGPETRLVIIGGGDRPKEALARFVAWAGGASALAVSVSSAVSEVATATLPVPGW